MTNKKIVTAWTLACVSFSLLVILQTFRIFTNLSTIDIYSLYYNLTLLGIFIGVILCCKGALSQKISKKISQKASGVVLAVSLALHGLDSIYWSIEQIIYMTESAEWIFHTIGYIIEAMSYLLCLFADIFAYLSLAAMVFVVFFAKSQKAKNCFFISKLWFLPATVCFVFNILYFVSGYLVWGYGLHVYDLVRIIFILIEALALIALGYWISVYAKMEAFLGQAMPYTAPYPNQYASPQQMQYRPPVYVAPPVQYAPPQQVQYRPPVQVAPPVQHVPPQPAVQPQRANNHVPTPNATVATQAQNASEALKTYKELLDSKVITQEDYEKKKKEILGL